jgi:hypothetical protein
MPQQALISQLQPPLQRYAQVSNLDLEEVNEVMSTHVR